MIRDSIPAEELLHKARMVGQYYGFTPLSTLTLAARGGARAKAGYPEAVTALALEGVAEMVAGFLKRCQGAACAPTPRQPLFIWHTNIAEGRPAQRKRLYNSTHSARTERLQTPSSYAQFSLLRATSSMKSRPFASIPWATRRLARATRASSPPSSRSVQRRFPKSAWRARNKMSSSPPNSPSFASARRTSLRRPSISRTRAENVLKTCLNIWR